MSDLHSALAHLREQLAWRGPTGRTMGHIVLTREQAEALVSLDGAFDRGIEAAANHVGFIGRRLNLDGRKPPMTTNELSEMILAMKGNCHDPTG